MNVNADLSTAPVWLVVLVIAAALAAELITGDTPPPPGLSPEECADLCAWEVVEWTPYVCRCR